MAASLTVVQLRAGYYVTMWWSSSFPVHAAAHPLPSAALKVNAKHRSGTQYIFHFFIYIYFYLILF